MDIHRKLGVLEHPAKVGVLEQWANCVDGPARQLRVIAQQPKLRVLEFGVGCHGPVHTCKIARKVSDSPEYYVGIVSGRRPSPNHPVMWRHAWLIFAQKWSKWLGNVWKASGQSWDQLKSFGVGRHGPLHFWKITRKVSDSREYYVEIVSGRHPSPNRVVMHEWFYPRCSYIMMQSLSFAK